ncbi:hypothetical protein BDR03DRAFT_1061985 [Suillus americanus]|nr:hypothetical protein BDR03DRAFT_1061985 [Suillus americanus]
MSAIEYGTRTTIVWNLALAAIPSNLGVTLFGHIASHWYLLSRTTHLGPPRLSWISNRHQIPTVKPWRTFVEWNEQHVAMHPFAHVTRKAQAELHNIISPDRIPEFHDQKSLPCNNELINGTLRWRPVTVLGGRHMLSHRSTNAWVYSYLRAGFCQLGRHTIDAHGWYVIRGIVHDAPMFPDPRLQAFGLHGEEGFIPGIIPMETGQFQLHDRPTYDKVAESLNMEYEGAKSRISD